MNRQDPTPIPRTRTRPTRRARVIRLARSIAAALALLVMFAWAFDAVASARALRAYPAPGDFLDIDGTRIHYLCMGDGDTTLALQHGYAGGVLDWLPLMEELATDMRVCAFDRPGNDYSSLAPKDARTVEQLTTLWHGALSQLGIDRPVVVGHSLGGAFALEYAARYPVAGVVLIEGLTPDAADAVTRRLGSYRPLVPLARLGLLRPLAPAFVHPSFEGEERQRILALRSRGAAIAAVGLEGRLARRELGSERLLEAERALSAPLLIVAAGATDVPEGEIFTHGLETMAARHPGATLRRIPGARHYVMVTHAREVATAIVGWLSEDLP